MKMRTSLGLFLLLLIGAILAPPRRPPATGHGGTWHVGQSSYPQADSGSALLEQSGESRAKVAAASYGKLPLRFEANQGQADLRVKFLSRGSGYTLFLTSTEAVLALQKPSLTIAAIQRYVGNTPGNRRTSSAVLRMKIGGANRIARIEGLESLPGKSSYFIGDDPAKWRTNVPTYAKVRYEGVYPGVDLVYYGNQGRLEYDFVIAPGTNPRTIRLVIVGAERLEASARGDLVLNTGSGEVRLQKPVVYQESGNVRKEIAGRYVLRGKRQIGFEVATYDASKPLIIDPLLSYSTYLGGSGDDVGNAIAVDSSGNAYVTGFTGSTNFPTKSPTQSASGGGFDAFVAKLDPTGSTLFYSTFLGGSADDAGNAIAVDGSGNAYVTGVTRSTNFPTKNALQSAVGGSGDAFVAKLDPTGSTLIYSTFLGGSAQDSGSAIAVDSSGNAYVTGFTRSTNFPTASPFQASCQSCAGSQGNAFVAKLSVAGSALVYSTYLGGSGNGTDGDFGNGIAVDASNNAYVTGFTSSPNFPLASPIQATLLPQTCTFEYYGYTYTIPCSNTAFVTKLNPSGSALLYSTYLGASGGGLEDGRGIAVDNTGNAYITGFTPSRNLLLTPGAFQLVPGGGEDAFVAKISPNDAPGFSLSSFSLSFQDEGIGGTTPSQQITLANTGSATLTAITSIVPSGDFAETNTCGSNSLAGGAACAINVTFTPTAAGVRTGTITITDSAASSPQKVTLTGNGVAGLAATVSPTSLSFGNQTQGTTSAAQSVTLTNTGSATLTINGFSLGGANPSDFTLSSANCKQSQSLAVGSSCAFAIVFAPLAVGNLSATLQILDNSAQSPRNVPLTGVGLAPPTVALSPTSLNFAAQIVGSTSSGQSVTLTTSGSGTLAISSISASIGDFKPSNNCGVSVAGGASCTITVTFNPIAPGNRTGMLVIASNAANGTQMVPLSGLGIDFSISPAAGSPNSATVTSGQSATYTLSAAGSSGFSGTVSFTCSDPAFQSSCGVSPNSLVVNGTTAQNATVTVTTTARSALPPRWHPPILPLGLRVALPWLLLLLSIVILASALRRRSRWRRAWVGLAAMLMAAALFFGCGGGGAPPPPQGTPSGAYTITVSATSAGVTLATMLSLSVN